MKQAGPESIAAYLIDLLYMPNERPSAGDIKKRWKELCQKHHPDKGGDPKAFHKVTHAYKMLTDPEYRAEEMNRIVREENGNLRGDLDVQIRYQVSFDDAFFGRDCNIGFTVNELDENLKPIRSEGPTQEVRTENVFLRIPASTSQPFDAVYPGQGHYMGAIRGDVQVVCMIEKHPMFELRGMSIYARERLPLHLLIKGGSIDVQTMYGIRPLKVPAGTEPGTELKIQGCGVARRGSHIVRVDMVYPKKDDLKKKDWKGLPIDWSIMDEKDEEEHRFQTIFDNIRGRRAETTGFIK